MPTVCGVAAQVTTRKSDSAAMASRLSTKRFQHALHALTIVIDDLEFECRRPAGHGAADPP